MAKIESSAFRNSMLSSARNCYRCGLKLGLNSKNLSTKLICFRLASQDWWNIPHLLVVTSDQPNSVCGPRRTTLKFSYSIATGLSCNSIQRQSSDRPLQHTGMARRLWKFVGWSWSDLWQLYWTPNCPRL